MVLDAVGIGIKVGLGSSHDLGARRQCSHDVHHVDVHDADVHGDDAHGCGHDDVKWHSQGLFMVAVTGSVWFHAAP